MNDDIINALHRKYVADLADYVGFRPETSVETGVRRFVDWYREFYQV